MARRTESPRHATGLSRRLANMCAGHLFSPADARSAHAWILFGQRKAAHVSVPVSDSKTAFVDFTMLPVKRLGRSCECGVRWWSAWLHHHQF